MIPPGEHKFKLRKLKEPIYNKKLDITYEFICDELKDAPACKNCHNGLIYVAYGVSKGIWDVYSFPCKCTYPSGIEWWQADELTGYENRPTDFQCKHDDIPGYVFIHPVHRQGWQKLLKHIGQIRDRQKAELGEEVPF
jgi:hypothetical protein